MGTRPRARGRPAACGEPAPSKRAADVVDPDNNSAAADHSDHTDDTDDIPAAQQSAQ